MAKTRGAQALSAGAAALLLLAACSSSPDGSTGTGTTTAPTASPSATRDLGPDPGGAAYRSLDVCALAPAATLRTTLGQAVRTETDGPGACGITAEESGVTVRLEVGPSRPDLPPEVVSTDAGGGSVDTDSTGTLIADAGGTSIYVLSASGHVLRVTGVAGVQGTKDLTQAVAASAREVLAKEPPQLSLPSDALSALDICETGQVSEVAQSLGATEPLEARADGRVCGDPQSFWVAFHGHRDFPANHASEPATIGSVEVRVASGCQVLIPVEEAPPDAPWGHESLLATLVTGGDTECEGFLTALEPLVEQLTTR